MMRMSELFGTFFYVGKFPRLPGTMGSAAAVLLVCLLRSLGASVITELYCIVILLLAGVICANQMIKASNHEDPQQFVLDEVLGIFVTFLMVPIDLMHAILGFALFRLFDIWKPFPIRRLEKLPGGWGVMMDDVVAGAFANVLLRLIL